MTDTFFLIVGIIIAGISFLIIFFDILDRIRCTERTEADIVKLKMETTKIRGSTRYHYRPVIRYMKDIKEYREEAPFRTIRERKYEVGQTMVVYVNPKKPSQCCFRKYVRRLFISLLFFAFGVLLIVCYFL